MPIKHPHPMYKYVMASDLDRDGMALEVRDNDYHVVLEIFYSDQDHKTTFSAGKEDIPLHIVEHAIATAKQCLPVVEKSGPTTPSASSAY